jgi:hypothetical protein
MEVLILEIEYSRFYIMYILPTSSFHILEMHFVFEMVVTVNVIYCWNKCRLRQNFLYDACSSVHMYMDVSHHRTSLHLSCKTLKLHIYFVVIFAVC